MSDKMKLAAMSMAILAGSAMVAGPRSRTIFDDVLGDDPQREIDRILADGGPRFYGYDRASKTPTIGYTPPDKPIRKFKHNRRG